MSGSGHKSLPTIGFLTVLEQPEVGWTGGYLVLNTLGRPLEFHCTAPVKTSRAQEILYGPTLRPFLLGEQIGQTLLKKSQHQPLLVCTDLADVLAVRELTATPVAWLLGRMDTEGGDARQAELDRPGLHLFELEGYRFAVANRWAADGETITSRWQPLTEAFDLEEPFERIREAIAEAQRGARSQAA
jgi:hypothetical protein